MKDPTYIMSPFWVKWVKHHITVITFVTLKEAGYLIPRRERDSKTSFVAPCVCENVECTYHNWNLVLTGLYVRSINKMFQKAGGGRGGRFWQGRGAQTGRVPIGGGCRKGEGAARVRVQRGGGRSVGEGAGKGSCTLTPPLCVDVGGREGIMNSKPLYLCRCGRKGRYHEL